MKDTPTNLSPINQAIAQLKNTIDSIPADNIYECMRSAYSNILQELKDMVSYEDQYYSEMKFNYRRSMLLHVGFKIYNENKGDYYLIVEGEEMIQVLNGDILNYSDKEFDEIIDKANGWIVLRKRIEKRIQELNAADVEFCKDRWDKKDIHPFQKQMAREESNKVTFARQELESVLIKFPEKFKK